MVCSMSSGEQKRVLVLDSTAKSKWVPRPEAMPGTHLLTGGQLEGEISPHARIVAPQSGRANKVYINSQDNGQRQRWDDN